MHIQLPQLIIKLERWKWNKEYQLFISNLGHFKDEDGKPHKIYINSSGYVVVKTHHGWGLAHRLVMKTWRPT